MDPTRFGSISNYLCITQIVEQLVRVINLTNFCSTEYSRFYGGMYYIYA